MSEPTSAERPDHKRPWWVELLLPEPDYGWWKEFAEAAAALLPAQGEEFSEPEGSPTEMPVRDEASPWPRRTTEGDTK